MRRRSELAPALQVLATAVVLSLGAGCGSAEVAPLRVGSGPLPATEPLFFARELGVLPPELVHLVEMYSASSAVNALRAGSLDAAVLALPDLLRLAQRGSQPRIVAVLALGDGGAQLLVVRRDRLEAARPALEALLRGWYAAVRRRSADPPGAQLRMARRLRITPAALDAALLKVRYPSASAALLYFEPGSELWHAAEAAQHELLAARELRAPVDLGRLFDRAALIEVSR